MCLYGLLLLPCSESHLTTSSPHKQTDLNCLPVCGLSWTIPSPPYTQLQADFCEVVIKGSCGEHTHASVLALEPPNCVLLATARSACTVGNCALSLYCWQQRAQLVLLATAHSACTVGNSALSLYCWQQRAQLILSKFYHCYVQVGSVVINCVRRCCK
jgi:hypothetical protein